MKPRELADNSIRWNILSVALLALRLALLLTLVALGVFGYRAWRKVSTAPVASATSQVSGDAATREMSVASTPVVDERKWVGVIAGHWQSDSGAVCPDGLQEVDINLDIARRVVDELQRQGYRAELLPEFSDKLTGYVADALISIHTDSCLKGRSGFKVARAVYSAVPEEEDRLVECLYREYEKSTRLKRDEKTITENMLQYHAFGKIAAKTPGAIIEIGFMSGDRKLLTGSQSRVARGIVAGLVCFLQGGT